MTTSIPGNLDPAMVTRYFDEPIPVRYRTTRRWLSVTARAVRRTGGSYTVLIAIPLPDGTERTLWVAREHVRPAPVDPRGPG